MAAAEAPPASGEAGGALDSAVATRPTFRWEDVAPVARSFGDGHEFEFVKMLESERDQNFLLRGVGCTYPEDMFVLKVHNRADEAAFVELQTAALLRARAADARCQRLLELRGEAGRRETELPEPGGQGRCICRLLTFMHGQVLGDLLTDSSREPMSEAARAALWGEIGAAVGRVSAALQGLDHPAAHREFAWDLAICEQVVSLRLSSVIEDRRPLLDSLLANYRARIVPLLPRLRKSIAHNDPNDYNLVVDDAGCVGVLDFGDMLYTYTCADAAICMAYLLFHCPDSVALAESVAPFVERYHAQCPLEEAEVLALFGLAVMRACTSVCMSAYQSSLEPDNEYLLISAAPAWRLLERVAAEDADAAAPAVLLRACGFSSGGSAAAGA